MRINSNDKTLKKNHIQTYQYLIKEYEQVKNKEHSKYKTPVEFENEERKILLAAA